MTSPASMVAAKMSKMAVMVRLFMELVLWVEYSKILAVYVESMETVKGLWHCQKQMWRLW
jgi:hypothetical protein